MQAVASPPVLLKDSAARRQTMVDCQIRTFDVTDRRVIARFLAVPRERFLPETLRELAYSDVGLTTPAGRYILPPLVLARLIQGAGVRSTDHVLDVAAGTGYSSAILAGLAASVTALEATSAFVEDLETHLADDSGPHVTATMGELDQGCAKEAPFDAILVGGAVEGNLDTLFAQLAEGGRLVTILRAASDPSGRAAKAICFEKRNGDIGTRYLFDASAPILPAFRQAPSFTF